MSTEDINDIMSPTIHDWKPSDGYIDTFNEEVERAAFEAAMQDSYDMLLNDDGSLERYSFYDTQCAWEGWLARAKQGAK